MALIDQDLLGIQDMTDPEDNPSILDQGEMEIVIHRDQTRELHNLHRLFLDVSDVDVQRIIRSSLIVRKSRRCWKVIHEEDS